MADDPNVNARHNNACLIVAETSDECLIESAFFDLPQPQLELSRMQSNDPIQLCEMKTSSLCTEAEIPGKKELITVTHRLTVDLSARPQCWLLGLGIIPVLDRLQLSNYISLSLNVVYNSYI